jgi:hypothetical protein
LLPENHGHGQEAVPAIESAENGFNSAEEDHDNVPRVRRGAERGWKVGKVMLGSGYVILKVWTQSCIGFSGDKQGKEMKCAIKNQSP